MSSTCSMRFVSSLALAGVASLTGCASLDSEEADLTFEGEASQEEVGESTESIVTATSVPHAVVRHYFPSNVWFTESFTATESCAWPAQNNTNNGVALYTVRPHPDRASDALISVGLLFRRDCGYLNTGIDSHSGDVESFYMTLSRDSLCSSGWRLNEVRTVAHSGNPSNNEIGVNTLDSCSPLQDLYVSPNKHALYLSPEQAGLRVPAEPVNKSWKSGFQLYNAGSAAAPQINDLGALGFPGERVWDDPDGHFCGGLSCSASRPGAPRDKLTTTNRTDISRPAHIKRLRVSNNAAYTIRYRTIINNQASGWTEITGGLHRDLTFNNLDSVGIDIDYNNANLFDGPWKKLCDRDYITEQHDTFMRATATGSLFNRGCSFDFPRGLGGFELHSACANQRGPGAYPVLLAPPYSSNAVFHWACRQNGVDYGIDVHQLCRTQYGNSAARANFKDSDNAYTWYCYIP